MLGVKSIAEDALAEGRLFTVSYTSPSLSGSGGTALVGWFTGIRPVEFMDRTYTATMDEALIELFELPYSGGVKIPTQNRNFVVGGEGSVEYVSAPTATITGVPVANTKLLASSSSGSSRAGYFTDSERFILKPMTQYVLRETNQSSGAGIITFRFTYRELELV